MITPNDPRLTAYVLGELDEADQETLRAAIAASPELQQAVRELEETCTMLKTSFASELPANATVSLVQPAAAAKTEKSLTPIPARNRFTNVGWVVTATLLLAVIGAAIWPFSGWLRKGDSLTGLTFFSADSGSPESGRSPASPSAAGNAALSDGDVLNASEVIESLRDRVEPGGTREIVISAQGDDRIEVLMVPGVAGAVGNGQSEGQNFPGDDSVMNELQRESKSRQADLPTMQDELTAITGLTSPTPEKFEQSASRRTEYESGRPAGEEGKRGPNNTKSINGKITLLGEVIDGSNGQVAGEGSLDGRFNKNSFGLALDDSQSMQKRGMGGGDRYDPIIENAFLSPRESPLSTFSIDVDTASYSKVRSYLKNYHQLPPPGAVRIEELVNYFPYSYAPPVDDTPFAAHQSVVACPWNPAHKLVRVALKGREIPQEKRPSSNLVFLLDVSGSMNESNRLPLVKRGIQMLINQLGENDRVAMVVYAGAAGLVLDSTTGDQKTTLLAAIDRLSAGGSTNGGDGIRLAYQLAQDHFITGGINRVILCTDGDFNVGTTSTDELVGLVEEKARGNVFLTVLGFGMGNLNDAMLEQISNRGNGTYAFIDTDHEAHKVMVEQLSGTLQTIAKDVKIQIEFNPARVAAYRLIGYENRILAAEDFNNDRKDAGEIGAGHTVTALYEIVPAGSDLPGATPQVDDLKYQAQPEAAPVTDNGELLTLKLRYKQPEGATSQLLEFPLVDGSRPFGEADRDFQFAAAVAAFGMKLRGSQHAGTISWPAILEIAQSACGADDGGYRTEFVELVRLATGLAGSDGR